MIEIAALIIGITTTSLIALTVFAKNSHSITNRLFIGLSVGIVGWSITNYLSLHTSNDEQTLFWIRWIMFFVVIQNTFFFLMVRVFPSNKFNLFQQRKYIIAVLYSLLTALIAISPFLFVDFKSGAPVPGPGMALFMPHALIFAGIGFIMLLIKHHKAKGLKRVQLQYFLAGTVLMFTLVPIGNFVIPIIFKNNQLVSLSPLYSIIFSGLIAYAIIAKKMFDIKRTVARSVTYILSLGFIGVVYGGMIFILSFFLTSDSKFDNTDRIIYILLALISAILFPPTKRFFDKLTNHIFYRGSYDPEQFLDNFNSTVVGNIELGIMLRHTTGVIQENISSQFCFVEIKGTSTTKERLIGTGELELSKSDNEILGRELVKTGKQTIITDELSSDFKILKDVLSMNKIGLLIRLMPGTDMSKPSMYYLILGDKMNGNIYDQQDVRILEIIADELLIAIQNSLRFEEIEQFNVTLQQKVNDATAKLQHSNKKLRDLDETKDEFISMASHQLRTPLTSVKGYMSMVLEGDAGKINKQQKDLLNQAFVSSQRMVYLIADLLNVSRLKTGKFVIEASPTNLADVIEGEIEQLRETAKSKKIEIVYDKPKDFPTLSLDETKIRQVIMNFADNAIYYTQSGGKINVELSEDKSHVYFKVIDNGLGIPESDIPHLFTKFYRASNARKARPDGTGLGLFMAKKVIDAQGGNILFESKEGKGSTFGFYFNKRSHLIKKPSSQA